MEGKRVNFAEEVDPEQVAERMRETRFNQPQMTANEMLMQINQSARDHPPVNMRVDDDLFLHALDRVPLEAQQFRPATREFLTWLREQRVAVEIVEHFAAFSVRGEVSVEIGFATFGTEQLIRSFHEDTPEYLRAGWLIIGSMPNGDFVVLDLGDNGAVGYVSHEEIWDEPHHVRDDLHNIYIRICDSVGEFLTGLLTDKWPYDYFDAHKQPTS